MNTTSTAQTMAHILANCKTIAVVGLSPKPHRDSYHVSQYMQAHGYRIVPINPTAQGTKILGEMVYATLTQAAAQLPADAPIDLVNVFRNSADVPPVMDEAIGIHAKAVWLQIGIAHAQAAAKASSAGLHVVQNKCLMVEHRTTQPSAS